jgi:ABC-type phosphate/phosphonate transport system substrate-binding protein
MAKYFLRQQGLDTEKKFQSIAFAGTHDAVVYAVRDGQVDAGTVLPTRWNVWPGKGKLLLLISEYWENTAGQSPSRQD